ncbi:MAG: AarF/UbiB family protein, partial [Plesiomonas sp.]
MMPSDFRRLYRITQVFLSYGLDELLPDMRLTLPLRIARKGIFWIKNQHPEKPLGMRLRLALQSLGPVWIKFGQMLSTRRDLFPPHIADQLALLQDQVASFDGQLARQQIDAALGVPLETLFDEFNPIALASASIAQVHTARLKSNGQEVVLKVIRPDILPIIKADVRLMYRLARTLPRLLPDGRRLRPVEVVREYEKTLLDELNLMREAANAIQLRRNFTGSPMLYVPEIYTDYCRESLLVMERIYGIPVSDISALHANGTNMKLLAERGVQVFFTQVFRDSFFHADMHPGNIFVSYQHPEDPQYIGIDCGIVGSLNREDKRYLAGNFIAFFNRDYRK